MTIFQVLEQADKVVKQAIAKELRDQGHYLTGQLEESIQGTIIESKNTAILQGEALFYSQILNTGVPPENIPYSPGARTSAGESKYIQALIQYFQLRMGVDEATAKRMAFATANKHAKEGMPSEGSSQYSNTGTRLHFLEEVNLHAGKEIDAVMISGLDQMVNEVFHQTKSETI